MSLTPLTRRVVVVPLNRNSFRIGVREKRVHNSPPKVAGVSVGCIIDETERRRVIENERESSVGIPIPSARLDTTGRN